MDINEVYQKIQDNDIQVFSHSVPDIRAISVETNNKYGIFINYREIENEDEEFLVMTHEYGHCVTGTTHPPYSPFDIIVKHERKADKRAILDFLPIEKIKDAARHGCKMYWEFAEYLDLPEAFVVKACKQYTAMGLM